MSSITTFQELSKRTSTYLPDETDQVLLASAYEYAAKIHFGEKRLTGEDYMVHPLNVAYILAEISADKATLCCALLHDILEQNPSLEDDLERQFGSEIKDLVVGITKINRLSFAGDNEANLANHRKILVGLSQDVRVIIVKLADRLHNMRTIWALPEKTQKEKAKQTLDILTPIAHRLGINSIKSELEDLCLRYYKPDVYFDIVEKLNNSKAERDHAVLEMQENVSKILLEHHIKHEIKGRSKSIFSIYKKLDKGKRFSDIYDLLALRVFVDTEADCYQALGIIHSKYRPLPKRFKDYIAVPKANLYQSLHTTVFGFDGHSYEIQIRTYEMDQIAERGIASHWSYKEKGKQTLQSEMEQKLQFFRSIMELKSEEATEDAFVSAVREDVLKDSIYVYTPKGDVVELPVGATPIDFAYKVHSGVGDHMVGAIVNDAIVPLDYELQDNDIIKINTNKNSNPNREWINMAKTNQAKNKIKAFFSKIEKVDYVRHGEDLLTRELRKRKMAYTDFMTADHIEKMLEEWKCSDLKEFYLSLGNGKITVTQVFERMTKETISKEEVILRKTQNNENRVIQIKADVIVEGIDHIKINIASCCKPIPGDHIVGYITKGYGITIHRACCPNISSLEERTIPVTWNDNVIKKYPTTIVVHTIDDRNILLEIISKTSSSDIIVERVNTLTLNEHHVYELTLLVENTEKLEQFMIDLKSISNIFEVERLIK